MRYLVCQKDYRTIPLGWEGAPYFRRYGGETKATVGGVPPFSLFVVFEPVAQVTPYLTDENGLGSCFGAAFRLPLHCGLISSTYYNMKKT